MRIRVSEPSLISDLLQYLQRESCLAVQTGRDIVAVGLSNGLPYDAARIAIGLHLEDWLAAHAGATARIID
jgi:hypothetical protein